MRILRQPPSDDFPSYIDPDLTDAHLARAITHELRYAASKAKTAQGTIYRLYSYTDRFGKPGHQRVDEVFVVVNYLDFLDRDEVAIVFFGIEGSVQEMEDYGR